MDEVSEVATDTPRHAVSAGDLTWISRALGRSSTCVLEVDADGVVLASVGDASTVLGVTEPVGTDLRSVVVPGDADRLAWLFQRVLREGVADAFEGRFRFADEGRVLEIVLVDTVPETGSLTATVTDVTRSRHAERLLARRATFDPLTGLFSRRELLSAAHRHARSGEGVAVLVVVDLARFRLVNEAHGPAVGDRLLEAVGHRLRDALGPDDVVARLGGDEFAALVVDPRLTGTARTAADHCHAAVHAGPVPVGEAIVPVQAWVGAQTLEQGDDPTSTLQAAVSAVAEARSSRRSVVVADASLREEAATRAALLADIAEAIEGGEIWWHYQPIVDPRDGRIHAVEALARWEHPVHGRVGPGAFVPLAEESGAILALGRAALDTCLRARTRLEQAWEAPPDVAVNVSALQLTDDDWLSVVDASLGAHGRDATGVTFELTESIAHDAVEVVAQLRDRGARVVIDDFGTGFSSLSMLHRLRVDGLKVDRSFTERLPDDADAATLVRGMLALAEALGLDTTVEGVETEAQRDLLVSFGATRCQGLLWHASFTLDELVAHGG